MIIELKDVSEKEMQDFLLNFVENIKDEKTLKTPLVVEVMNETLSQSGVPTQIGYDPDDRYAYIY